MNDRLFKPLRRQETQNFSRVTASIERVNDVTSALKPGWHGALRLSPYRQQEGTTCFFSGPIAVARDLNGVQIEERHLAQVARKLGLLTSSGASTAETENRKPLEEFVKKETGVNIIFHPHSYGGQNEDLTILKILIEHGNLAEVLYPISDERSEWETFFGIEKSDRRNNVRWHSNFSPSGTIKVRTTSEMADLLYGKPNNPYLLICEIQIQTPLRN